MLPSSGRTRPAVARRPVLRPAAAVVLGLGLLAVVACSGASSPTEPANFDTVLSTPYGSARVVANGCAFDLAAARDAVEAGYAQARSQIGREADLMSFDGVVIIMHPGPFDGAVGRYSPKHDHIEVAEGVERVLRHELQHRFCYMRGESRDCCFYQDHPNGYDLHCNRI
jgi:hypothetical protein